MQQITLHYVFYDNLCSQSLFCTIKFTLSDFSIAFERFFFYNKEKNVQFVQSVRFILLEQLTCDIISKQGEVCMTTLMKKSSSSDVRKKWSDFVDEVTNDKKPKLVSRNNKSEFLSLSLEQALSLLQDKNIDVEIIKENDGSYTVDMVQFDLFANEPTKEEALTVVAKDLIEYAKDYMEEIDLFYNSTNRKTHFPYVMNVLLQPNVNSVISLFNVKVMEND